MIDNPILVVEVNNLGGKRARQLFDFNGVKQNREYIFFNGFGEPVLNQLDPNRQQLVFLSHNDDLDAYECAAAIKRKNPKAIVFAVVATEVDDVERGSKVDAFIQLDTVNDEDVADIARGFIEGIGRVELIETIQGFSVEND